MFCVCCFCASLSPFPLTLFPPTLHTPYSVKLMHSHINPKNGDAAPLVADDVAALVAEHADRLDSEIIYMRDFDYDYFGFKTLERSYLLRVNGRVVERPQHMLMRVSVGIHKTDIDRAVETYHLLSERWFTHASPTLFNAGTPRPQLSSCFLVAMKGDSIEGIYDTLKECACVSKSAGGMWAVDSQHSRRRLLHPRHQRAPPTASSPLLRVVQRHRALRGPGGRQAQGAREWVGWKTRERARKTKPAPTLTPPTPHPTPPP